MQNEEVVHQIELSRLRPFPEHPFQVRDDDAMQQTVESIQSYGVLVPGIVRPLDDGSYCGTPEDLRDALLDAYANLREMELTDGERDLTEKEEAMLCAECENLTKKCDKETAICSS